MKIADCGLRIVELRIADCGLWIVDYSIADCGLRIVDCKLWSNPALAIFLCIFYVFVADPILNLPIAGEIIPQSAIRNPQSAIPQSALSLALLFEGDASLGPESALRRAMAAEGFTFQDQSIIDAATKALQPLNLLNLTRNQARSLGLALGVDFFVVARAQLVERAGVGARLYSQCYIALYFVGTRSGQLFIFDFIETQAPVAIAALTSAADRISERAPQYAQQLRAAFKQQLEARQLSAEDLAAIELPMEDSAPGFQPPSFLARRQPEYTDMARKMGISAVVEVEAVLRRDGTVGNVEVTRWAGFGLDEAAIAAVRQLKFNPAMKENQPISCRALIRYNFNYKVQ